jgi:PAS domain S-box-containing protein
MADAAPVLIWTSGLDKLCTWFNKPWLDFTGRTMEQELGNGWAENVHPDDFDRCLRTYSDAFDARRPFSMEYRLKRHDEEYRWLLDNGMPLLGARGEFTGYIGSCTDITNHKEAEELMRQRVREQETRAAAKSLMYEIARAINQATTWDDTVHRVLRRLCEAERWHIGYVYLPQPERPETIQPVVSCYVDDRFRPFHDLSIRQTYARGEQLPGRVYAENKLLWAEDQEALLTALPTRAAAATTAGLRAAVAVPVAIRGEVVAVLELFSDQVHPLDDEVTALMQSVGDQIGRVLEREQATARMADVVWREQQELLHTLHDSLGQTLTGLGMLSTGLRQRLPAHSETAETAAEIARQTQQALDQVRQLAKKLFPVEVQAESLMAALRDLASATESLHKVDVRVQGQPPEVLRDGKIATELYRITQEAVTNSVKHGRATAITIGLEGVRGLTRLTITDDGTGIPHPVPGDGAGLRIMHYRATSIGASLSVERGTTGGTVVTCTIRQSPAARKGHP